MNMTGVQNIKKYVSDNFSLNFSDFKYFKLQKDRYILRLKFRNLLNAYLGVFSKEFMPGMLTSCTRK